MFICKYCSCEFDTKYKLAGHVTHCVQNPKYETNRITTNNFRQVSLKPKITVTDTCKYCGKEITSTHSGITFHENRCKENPNKIIHPGNHGHTIGHTAWNKGLTAETNEIIKSATIKRHQSYIDGKWKLNSHKWTDEEKEKLCKGAINYIESQIGPYKCRYSKTACKYIDYINDELQWNLQHAENGGEVEICGYFLDGYDSKLNIAFEYDEPKHYVDVQNNILCDKDIERQNFIIDKINCDFYRYNESLHLLYKVN